MVFRNKEASEPFQTKNFLDSNGKKIDATAVSQFFDRSVTKIKDNKENIATRADNGYFYLPWKSGTKAFYLAPGETARVFERNNSTSKGRERYEKQKTGIVQETQGKIRNVDNEIINYEGTRAYYADPRYQSKETIKDIEQRLNAELGTNLSGNSPRRISDAFIQAVARYQSRKWLMVDGQAGQRTYWLLKWEQAISAQELVRQKDLTASESMNTILANKEYEQYLVLSNELSNAIARDASGPLIEGGLVGIFRRNTHLNKLLSSKSPEERARIETELDRLSGSFQMQEPNFIAKIFGARGKGYMKDVYGRKIDVRRQKTALAETLSVAALSLLISGWQSVTVLFGKIKTPFTIQKTPNPGRDVASYIISGQNSYSLESQNSKDQERLDYDLATASLKERQELVGNTSSIERAKLEYDVITGWKMNWKNRQHRASYLRLQRNTINAEPQNGPMFKTFVNMACSVTSIDEFASTYSLPQDPEVRKGLNTFYEGGIDSYGRKRSPADFNLLYEMLSDSNKYIGTASMVRVEMWQQDQTTHLNKYVNTAWNRTTRWPKENPDSFSTALRNLEASTVTERFENDNALMSAYMKAIEWLAWAKVSREELLRAIEQGQKMEITGYNTGLKTTRESVRRKQTWSWEAFVIAVPVENSANGPWVHMIGIRRECANYVPWSFVPESYVQEKSLMDIKARIPLLWNFQFNRWGGGHGNNKPDKPGEPNKPNPEGPEKPPVTPEDPVHNTGVSSTPRGTVTEWTSHTWGVVNWTAKNINANSSGAAVPWADYTGTNPYPDIP